MAKKTAAKKAPAKKPASTASTPKKKAASKAKPAAQPKAAISTDQIGFAAGDTWGFLHGKGWQTLAAVKKGVDHPTDVTMLALGWLAREGKLDFETIGRSVKVTLRV
ncbi:MAG: winged helix-turn-helix domain-containing protein [Planctomycetota bacterium]